MTIVFGNRVKMTTATTGTGTLTLGSAVTGYQSFAAGGISDGDSVHYVIEDGSDWEVGVGVYTSSGTTMSRTVLESSNAGSAISLSGAAVVMVTALAVDFRDLFLNPCVLDVRTYTSSGSFEWHDDATLAILAIGGGGAGANESGTGSTVRVAASGGGGGGTAIKYAYEYTAGDTLTITIGAGGAAGSNNGANGGTGGTTSVTGTGLSMSAVGGNGGTYTTTAGATVTGGAGGTASGGDDNYTGGAGGDAMSNTSNAPAAGGGGAPYDTYAPSAINGETQSNPASNTSPSSGNAAGGTSIPQVFNSRCNGGEGKNFYRSSGTGAVTYSPNAVGGYGYPYGCGSGGCAIIKNSGIGTTNSSGIDGGAGLVIIVAMKSGMS